MAQFDVFRNPGRARDDIPYLISLQSSRLDRNSTRFVAPLGRYSNTSVAADFLMPIFIIEQQRVFLDVFNLATIPAHRLGQPITRLTDEYSRARIIRAIDELISQA